MFAGITLMLLGVIFALQQAGVVTWFRMAHLLPLALIAIGLSSLLRPRAGGCRTGGWLMLIGGAWLLLAQLHLFWVGRLWPLLLVAIGISMVWKQLAGRQAKVEQS